MLKMPPALAILQVPPALLQLLAALPVRSPQVLILVRLLYERVRVRQALPGLQRASPLQRLLSRHQVELMSLQRLLVLVSPSQSNMPEETSSCITLVNSLILFLSQLSVLLGVRGMVRYVPPQVTLSVQQVLTLLKIPQNQTSVVLQLR